MNESVNKPNGSIELDKTPTTPTLSSVTDPVKRDLKQENRHRILTCNILLSLSEHEGTIIEWEAHRRAVCEQVIKSHNPDIVCLQEVGLGQNQDFVNAFSDYVVFGYVDPYVERIPKRFQAAKNVIMYSRKRYAMEAESTYWLSENPFIAGSRGPGSGLPRHVTWVRLKDKQSGATFRVLDTHWDLKQDRRLAEAKTIAAETSQYLPEFPQLLCGDLNSSEQSEEHKVLTDVGWKNTYEAVHGAVGSGATGHGFRKPLPQGPDSGNQIDFILYRGQVKPVAAEVIRDSIDGQLPSDHYFVSADVLI